jgi:hypothetical protein
MVGIVDVNNLKARALALAFLSTLPLGLGHCCGPVAVAVRFGVGITRAGPVVLFGFRRFSLFSAVAAT